MTAVTHVNEIKVRTQNIQYYQRCMSTTVQW